MSWNYRVVKTVDPKTNTGTYGIHEVYYDRETGKPDTLTAEPTNPLGETPGELARDAVNYMMAFNAPVLEYKDGKFKTLRTNTRLEIILDTEEK